MAFEVDLLNPQTIMRLISEIRSSENVDRKVRAFNAWRMAMGDMKPFVFAEVERLLPQSAKQMRISDVSLSAKVTKKLAQSYKESPMRQLENDIESEAMNELYEKIDVDREMKEYDFIRNLYRHALLWVNMDPDVGLQFNALKSFEYDVFRDSNNGTLKIVALQYPDNLITRQGPNTGTVGDSSRFGSFDNFSDSLNQAISNSQLDSASDTQTFTFWTKDQFVIVRAKFITPDGTIVTDPVSIDYITIPSNPTNVNPLGILPFVYSDVGGNETDYPFDNPITSQGLLFAVLFSDVLSASSIQGYGIRVLSGSPEMLNNIQRMHEGLTTAVKLPQSDDPNAPATTLDFKNPSPDLEGQLKTYASYLTMVLGQHGINAGSVLTDESSSFTSGLDRALSESETTNVLQQNQNDYGNVEKAAFEIVKAWSNTEGIDIGVKFSEDQHLMIHYPRPQILISDRETLENIRMRLDMGLIDKVDALRILNPNLTEQEAQDKIDSMEEVKQEKQQAFMNGMRDKDQADENENEQKMGNLLTALQGGKSDDS